jgi:hypothetical protein
MVVRRDRDVLIASRLFLQSASARIRSEAPCCMSHYTQAIRFSWRAAYDYNGALPSNRNE